MLGYFSIFLMPEKEIRSLNTHESCKLCNQIIKLNLKLVLVSREFQLKYLTKIFLPPDDLFGTFDRVSRINTHTQIHTHRHTHTHTHTHTLTHTYIYSISILTKEYLISSNFY